MIEYIPGNFIKYLNNNGAPVRDKAEDFELVEKAICLSHFSYEKSGNKLLLVDIQGSGYNLNDPEIACVENALDDEGGLRFCMGSLVTQAFETFSDLHYCNHYYIMVGLKKLDKLNTL